MLDEFFNESKFRIEIRYGSEMNRVFSSPLFILITYDQRWIRDISAWWTEKEVYMIVRVGIGTWDSLCLEEFRIRNNLTLLSSSPRPFLIFYFIITYHFTLFSSFQISLTHITRYCYLLLLLILLEDARCLFRSNGFIPSKFHVQLLIKIQSYNFESLNFLSSWNKTRKQ